MALRNRDLGAAALGSILTGGRRRSPGSMRLRLRHFQHLLPEHMHGLDEQRRLAARIETLPSEWSRPARPNWVGTAHPTDYKRVSMGARGVSVKTDIAVGSCAASLRLRWGSLRLTERLRDQCW